MAEAEKADLVIVGAGKRAEHVRNRFPEVTHTLIWTSKAGMDWRWQRHILKFIPTSN